MFLVLYLWCMCYVIAWHCCFRLFAVLLLVVDLLMLLFILCVVRCAVGLVN